MLVGCGATVILFTASSSYLRPGPKLACNQSSNLTQLNIWWRSTSGLELVCDDTTNAELVLCAMIVLSALCPVVLD